MLADGLHIGVVLRAESNIIHHRNIKHGAFSCVQFLFSLLFNLRQRNDCIGFFCNGLFSFARLPAVSLGTH